MKPQASLDCPGVYHRHEKCYGKYELFTPGCQDRRGSVLSAFHTYVLSYSGPLDSSSWYIASPLFPMLAREPLHWILLIITPFAKWRRYWTRRDVKLVSLVEQMWAPCQQHNSHKCIRVFPLLSLYVSLVSPTLSLSYIETKEQKKHCLFVLTSLIQSIQSSLVSQWSGFFFSLPFFLLFTYFYLFSPTFISCKQLPLHCLNSDIPEGSHKLRK